MVKAVDDATVKTQIEYYLSDANLTRDKFFRDQILVDKEGWVAIAHFLNCNKVKNLGIGLKQIGEACKDSTEVEVSKDGTKIRRAGNKELPAFSNERKRDAKATDKNAAAVAKAAQEDEFDKDGKIILVEKDFDNPLIIAFKVEGAAAGDESKASWKDVEKTVKEQYPTLKLVYARGDDKGGHLAFSNLRLKEDQIDKLCEKTVTIAGKPFKFEKIEGETLKEFWQAQGGHYNFCI